MNESERDALWSAALNHHRAGRVIEAISLYDRIIDDAPALFFPYANRGAARLALGQHDAAIADFDRALTLQPDDFSSHSNRGLALTALARPGEALAAFERALILRSSHVEALLGRMTALLALGHSVQAVEAAQELIIQRPDLANGRYGLGLALNALERHAEAIAAFDAAIVLSPNFVDAYLHRGGAFYALGQLDQAVEAYDHVLALSPGLEQAHYNRGKALADLDRPDEALASYDRAITLQPDNPDSHLNRGAALQAVGEWPAAVEAYNQAIAISPDHVQAHANLAMARLALGDLRSGFILTEWRKKTREAFGLRFFDRPEWHGDAPIEGKVLLVHSEQGLGDTLQFCRYLDLIRSAGAEPILVCQPPLKALLTQSFPEIRVFAEGEDLPPFDLYAAMLSLPADFETDFVSIPNRMPYLRADPAKVEAWRCRLGDRDFKIGVSWHCSRLGAAIGKSFPLTALNPIADLPGVRLISLQKGDGSEELLAGGVRIETLGEHFDAGANGFLDSAAVMESLDLLITPDTALAHLAGGLDRPVWMALKFSADWRWLINRDDTPWYRSMRLFRQARRGDWDSVFEAMRDQLAIRLSS